MLRYTSETLRDFQKSEKKRKDCKGTLRGFEEEMIWEETKLTVEKVFELWFPGIDLEKCQSFQIQSFPFKDKLSRRQIRFRSKASSRSGKCAAAYSLSTSLQGLCI